MSLIGALTKAAKAGEAAKKTAPFYSAVDEALANIARPKGTGAEFLTELSKQAGVKKAELADRKLEQAFKAKGKITKEEAQQILKDNPPPKLQERQLTEISDAERDEALRDNMERFGYRSWDEVPSRVMKKWNDEIDEDLEKFGDYKTAGGKNYREILLKLPSDKPNAGNYRDPAKYDADLKAYNASGKSEYQSSHWTDDPNVLAHMRVQDRTGPNGEKILHVEEIQSDWHQAGRKKGYANPEAIAQAKQAFQDYSKDARERMRQLMLKEAEGDMAPDRALRFVNQYVDGMDDSAVASFLNEKSTFNELYRTARDAGKNEVPDAPFKKNWHELAMKRLLNYAADNGYDSIALTPGAEQAKRFSLSKQVDQITASQEEGGLRLFARDKQGKNHDLGVHPSEKLADVVGKDLAEKMSAQAKPYEIYQGVDLEVGGEGMKGFYDQILPSYLNTFGKPYGAQVGQMPIPINKGMHVPNPEGGWTTTPPETYSAHVFPITPQMRESIKQKGLPLYQQIGIPTAGAGAASQIPEEEEGMSGGGSVAKMAALAKLAKLREEMAPRAAVVKDLMAKDSGSYLRDVTPDVLTKEYIEQEIARMKARAEASQPEVKKADGGAINFDTAPDMSDEGRIIQGAPFKRGGKVNMTTNRDTMFLELSNKKLKRK